VHPRERHAPEQAHVDERVPAERRPHLGAERTWRTQGDPRRQEERQRHPEADRDYYLERRYPAFGNLVPRDVASRAAKERCDAGFGVNKTGEAVYLDFSAAIERYGKLEANVKNIENPSRKRSSSSACGGEREVRQPLRHVREHRRREPYVHAMKIYPAVHYTMGGLWVDYNLQTTVPGLFCLGEANFSDHGANRLGASALMQGLADGYFVIPYTVGDYLADDIRTGPIDTKTPRIRRGGEGRRIASTTS
jgi:succinate dehydrogenase / fumarate reductase flavoprotein subunit